MIETRPGAVVLSRSLLHPGGGGQVADRAVIEHHRGRIEVTGVDRTHGVWWHQLDGPLELQGEVLVTIDAEYRARVAKLHTASHILNALVFQHFDGALVTGAQINGDGTARMDFDLPDVSNDAVRALEPEINDAIRESIQVRRMYRNASEAAAIPGMIRSLSVTPPPTADGRLRIIEITGLDQQACGGTHIANTSMSEPVAITKIDNKGRRNRRVRMALQRSGDGSITEVAFV